MKRLLLLALIGLSLVPELAHAQRRKRQASARLGVTIGAKGGIAYTNIAGYVAIPGQIINDAYEARVKPIIGGLVNYRFTSLLSAQAEVLFAPRGSQRTRSIGTVRTQENFRLTYVDIPVLAKINTKIFYIEGGVVGSVLAAQSIADSKEKFGGLKPLDVGYAFGAGIEMPIGAIFGARYVRSTSAIGQGGYLAGSQLLENTAIQITGGYIFGKSGGRGRGRRR